MTTKQRIAAVYAGLGLRSVPTIIQVNPDARTACLLERWDGVLRALAR